MSCKKGDIENFSKLIEKYPLCSLKLLAKFYAKGQ